jgi:hypothetical protein
MRGNPRLPPDDFQSRILPITRVGGIFYRCAHAVRPLLDWDARDTSRFSHPTLPFPVLYLAAGKFTAFWECFGDELNDQPQGEKALSASHALSSRRWIRFSLSPLLRVADVTDAGTLRAMGADGASFLADYKVTQRWAEALMQHPTKLDGIRYRSRLDNDQNCLAVFGRPQLLRARKRLQPKREASLLQDVEFLLFLAEQDIALL